MKTKNASGVIILLNIHKKKVFYCLLKLYVTLKQVFLPLNYHFVVLFSSENCILFVY